MFTTRKVRAASVGVQPSISGSIFAEFTVWVKKAVCAVSPSE